MRAWAPKFHGDLGPISRKISVETQLHHFASPPRIARPSDVRTSLETSFLYRNTAMGKLGKVVVCLANGFPIGRNIGDHSARPNYLRFRERFDIRMGATLLVQQSWKLEINSP
jgi:hypothetical protein